MGDEAVKVVVRCRPMNSKETAEGRKPVVDVNSSANMVTIINPDANAISADPKSFTFDAVYDSESTQRAVYDETAYPLVDSVLSGYNGTIFAYGQTGCGKTHTMQGRNEPAELRGIIPNSFDHIFDHIKLARDKEFLVRCSYLEIYNEEIRDLLAKDPNQKMELHETPDTGVFVKDLTQVVVDSGAAIDKVMTDGNKHRTTGATLMNDQSSRSHSIFTIIIEMSSMGEDGKDHITRGKLNLVDLAGSERPAKTGATGTRMKEGIKINLSLTALGNVISALVEGAGKARHIPYRDSKLTRLLQDSLGGNTKTVMVAAVGPADYNYDETLSTLRYANRAKNIKNKPVINEDPKDALLRQYKEEIDRLKQLLVQHLSAAGLAPEALNAILSQANAMGMAMGAAGGGGGGGGLGAMGAMMGAAAAAASGGGPSKALTNKPSASNLGKPSSGSSSSRSVAAGAALSAGSSGSGSDTPKAAPNAQLSPLPSPTDADAAGSSRRAATEAAATIIDGSPAAADQFDASNTAAGTDSGAGAPTTDNSSAAAAGDGLSPPPDNASGASGVTPSALPSGQATPSRPASGQAAPSTSTLTARPSITATPTAAGTSGAALADYARASPRGAAAATAAAKLSPTQSFRAGGSSNSINSGGSGNSAGNNSGAASANGSFAGLGAEAQEAIEAARRDAERERKEREELARKLLALQQMVVGKGGSSANGGPGGNGGGGASRNGGDLSGLLRSGSNGGADTDEIAQARAREDQRKADLLKAQQKRKAALSPQKSGDMGLDGGDGDGMDGDDEDPGAGNAGSNAGGDASAAAGTGGAGSGAGGGGAGGDRAKLTRPEKERLVKKVKAKYAGRIDALKREILDLQDEHAQQRESLMNTVREQSKEAKLLEALVALFLSPLEVSKVWERAVWNEETEEWSLPRVKPRPGFEIRSKVANRARQPLPRQKAGAVMPGAGNNKGGRSGVNAANSEGSDTETTTANNGGGYNTNGSVIGSDPGGLGSDASSYGGADAGMDGVSYGRYGNSDGYAEDNDDADEEGGAVIDGEGEVQARRGGGAMPRVKGAESQQQAGGRAASGGHRSKSNDDGSLPSLPGGGAPSGGNAGGRRPQHPAAGMDDSGGGGGLPSLGDRGRSQTKAAAAGSSGSATGGREATSMPAIGGRGNAQPYQQQQQQPPQANNGFFMLPGLGPGFHNIQIPGLQGLNGLGNLKGQLASLGSLGLAGLNLPALGALQRPMPAAMQQQPQQQMHDGGGGGLPMLRGPAAGAANGMYPQLLPTSGLPVALPGLASGPMPSQLQHHKQMNGNYQQQQLPMMHMPAMQQQQPPQQSYASIGGGGGLPSLSGGGPPSRGSSLPPAAAAGSSKSQSGGGLPSLGGGAKGGPGPSGGKKSSGLGALPAI